MTFAGIGVLGSGNIGSAFVRGWVRADPALAGRIMVADALPEAAATLGREAGVAVAAGNDELAQECDFVLLAVKPADVAATLEPIAGRFGAGKVLVSVAAGVAIEKLEGMLPAETPVIRLMPNLAVETGAGTICYAAGRYSGGKPDAGARELLGLLGEVVVLPETLFAAATAIAGSGPGFVAAFAEAFVDAGVAQGLKKTEARELTASMLTATGSLLSGTGMTPEELRQRVTSPAGTTAAGLAELESRGVRAAIISAVAASVKRAEELG